MSDLKLGLEIAAWLPILLAAIDEVISLRLVAREADQTATAAEVKLKSVFKALGIEDIEHLFNIIATGKQEYVNNRSKHERA